MDLAYIVAPLLLIAVVLGAVWLDRWSVPAILVAIGAGIVFGSDVLNLWHFDDVLLTNQVANMALVFILFHGGLVTERAELRRVALPAVGLATWGVALTAAASFVCLRFGLGWSFERALLLAVIVSSTDTAAIFSILRVRALPERLASVVKVESAANDPMAVLLTTVAVAALASGEHDASAMVLSFLWKFALGPAIGIVVGAISVWLFNRLTLQVRGYYYVLFIALVLLTYGLAEAAHASGMLAVFTAGLVVGDRPFVHKQGILNFSDALSSVANIGMFVLMGLLVFPHEWAGLWWDGTLLFLVLAFVARPVAVLIGTLGMRLGIKGWLFTSWAGLRGAVPIVLATYPAAAGLAVGDDVFNLAFFAVLLSILFQGSTLGLLAKALGLAAPARPPSPYALELITMAQSGFDLIVVDLPDPPSAEGPRIRDLALPEGAVIVLIVRGKEVVIPKGNSHLRGWDQVTVIARAADASAVRDALLRPFLERNEDGALPAGSSAAGRDEQQR